MQTKQLSSKFIAGHKNMLGRSSDITNPVKCSFCWYYFTGAAIILSRLYACKEFHV